MVGFCAQRYSSNLGSVGLGSAVQQPYLPLSPTLVLVANVACSWQPASLELTFHQQRFLVVLVIPVLSLNPPHVAGSLQLCPAPACGPLQQLSPSMQPAVGSDSSNPCLCQRLYASIPAPSSQPVYAVTGNSLLLICLYVALFVYHMLLTVPLVLPGLACVLCPSNLYPQPAGNVVD